LNEHDILGDNEATVPASTRHVFPDAGGAAARPRSSMAEAGPPAPSQERADGEPSPSPPAAHTMSRLDRDPGDFNFHEDRPRRRIEEISFSGAWALVVGLVIGIIALVILQSHAAGPTP